MTENKLYEGVEKDIKNKIEKGLLKQGEKLKSEDFLCGEYKVSKVTLRKALTDLINEGYLESKPRVGYFVKCAGTEEFSFLYDIYKCTQRPITESRLICAEVKEENGFGGERVKYIQTKKIFYCAGEPAALEIDLVYLKNFKYIQSESENDFCQDFVSKALSFASKKELTIEAVCADDRTADLLECFEGDALLKLTELFYDRYSKFYAQKTTLLLGEDSFINAGNKANIL